MTGKRRMGRDPEPQPPRPTGFPATPQRPAGFAMPPPPSEVVITPTPSRREARAQRRKQQRQRIGLAGGAAIVVAALVVVGAVVFGVHKAVTHGDGPSRSQTTLLLQIKGSTGSAAASVLLAHDPGPTQHQGVEVLIPSRVVTDVCGFGAQNFGDVLAQGNGDAGSRQAVSTMLGGITVDGSWVLSTTQFATLINKLGGITVDSVDVNVVQRTGGGGGTILVPEGVNEHLSGVRAVEYATYVASAHEDASAQLLRLQNVIDGMLAAMPKSPTAVAAILRQLGAGGDSTLGATKLATMLVGLSADYNSTGGFYPTDLPTTAIDAGGAPSYRVDDTSVTGVNALVKSKLANSLPAGAGVHRTSVFLYNGVGTPGLVPTACPKLAAHQLDYAGVANAPVFSNANSIIEIRSDNDVEQGDQVAKALGLPTSDIRLSRTPQNVADVIVTLGGDYKH